MEQNVGGGPLSYIYKFGNFLILECFLLRLFFSLY